jgi:hypothetical protein
MHAEARSLQPAGIHYTLSAIVIGLTNQKFATHVAKQDDAPPVLAQNVFGVGIGGGRSWNMYFGPGQYIGDFCDGCEVNILGSVACEHNGRKMRRSFTPKRMRRSCRATFVAMMQTTDL